MRHVARILFENGALIFNTGGPYDDQVVFDHAGRYAQSQGPIQLDLEGVRWTVNAPTGTAVFCGGCGKRLHRLSYTHGRLVLCARCVRTKPLVALPPPGPGTHAPARKLPRGKDGSPLNRRQPGSPTAKV